MSYIVSVRLKTNSQPMKGHETMKIYEIVSHRNGVAGNGFYVVRFDGRKEGGTKNMIATVFPERGNVAVFSIPLLADNNITFGQNSWRGDDFEPELRKAITALELGSGAAQLAMIS
jgi:hypothetical protein